MSTEVDATLAAEVVTLAEAAERLGVHYMTAYRYVRTGRMVAEKHQGKWWVTAEDLAAVVKEGTGPRRQGTSDTPAEPRELLVAPFTARLVAGDTGGCWDLISAALSGGAAPVEVHRRLLQTALVDVGDRWRQGELSIADEHRATATAYRLIGQMGPLFRHRGRRRGTIVLGAVSGDAHALPTAMLCDFLCDRRFEVIDLGANTPTESFLGIAADIDDIVGIGLCATQDEGVPMLLSQCTDIRDALPDTTLVVGGPAVNRTDPRPFTAIVDAISLTADEACDAFEAGLAAAAPADADSNSNPDAS